MRAFRDEYMLSIPEGRADVAAYYANAPRVVRAIDRLPAVEREAVYESLYTDVIVPAVALVNAGRYREAWNFYRLSAADLFDRFLGDGVP
jgi:hypothetical protein